MQRTLTLTIEEKDNGRFVRDILKKRLFLSATRVKKIKYHEMGILVNGVRVFLSDVVHTGDVLTVQIEDEADFSQNIVPIPGTLTIVFEDDDLLVVNKAADMAVHPCPGHYEDSLANIVMWYYQNQGKNFTFRPVNRLDRYTSGLMVIAKNAHVHELLRQQLMAHTLCREYLALAIGHVLPENGTINAPIARKEGSVLMREVSETGAAAVTHYCTEQAFQKYTLLRLRLDTGRTHQIRVHLASIGHPLLGDFLYGKECPQLIARTALHSTWLSLLHPITKELLQFSAPLPDDMSRLLK